MLRVEELHDFDSAPWLEGVWNSLLERTPDANYFQSFAWLRTYWTHRGGGRRLRLLVVRSADEPVGLVPLTVLREPSPLGALRVLTYPADYWGSFYGPIGGEPDVLLRAALEHVGRSRRDWDLLDLRFAPFDADDRAATTREMSRCGFPPSSSLVDHTSLIELPATFEAYLAERTSKWRNNYKRWRRRLDERGSVTFERYRPAGAARSESDPRWDLYDACEAIARKSWQGSSSDGTTLSHESVRPLLRDLHAAACRAGGAEINLLRIDGEPLAFLYAYHYRGSVFGLRIGYDERLSRDGVGNLLYARVIDDSIRRGDRLLDLGPGSIEAKRALTSRVAPIFRRTWANPLSLRGLAWRARRLLRPGVERRLGVGRTQSACAASSVERDAAAPAEADLAPA